MSEDGASGYSWSFSRFFTKLFYEILPAAIASAIGGFLFGHSGSNTPAAPAPTAAIASPADAAMMKMVHEDHTMFVDYLKKSVGASKDSSQARTPSDEHAEAALREAKEAEARALALSVRNSERQERERSEKKVAAKPAPMTQARLAPVASAPVSNPPVTLAPGPQTLGTLPASASSPAPSSNQALSPLPVQQIGQPPSPPAQSVAQQQPQQAPSGGLMGRLHDATSAVGSIFSAGTPPRPPGSVEPQNFNAAM